MLGAPSDASRRPPVLPSGTHRFTPCNPFGAGYGVVGGLTPFAVAGGQQLAQRGGAWQGRSGWSHASRACRPPLHLGCPSLLFPPAVFCQKQRQSINMLPSLLSTYVQA